MNKVLYMKSNSIWISDNKMNELFFRKVDYFSSGTENNDTLQVDYLRVFFLKLQKEKCIIKEMLPFEIEAIVHGIISSGSLMFSYKCGKQIQIRVLP